MGVRGGHEARAGGDCSAGFHAVDEALEELERGGKVRVHVGCVFPARGAQCEGEGRAAAELVLGVLVPDVGVLAHELRRDLGGGVPAAVLGDYYLVGVREL